MAKIALLIGVGEYSEGLPSIPSAIEDVEAMRRVLEHPDMGAFDEVTVLPNPDKGSMEKAVEDLFSNRQRDDLVLLYFSGHGIKDKNAKFYLSTQETGRDQKGDFRRSTALAASKLQEYITESCSKREVIILDCCFSGAFVQGMPIKGEIDIKTELGGKGRAILTSSSSSEYSLGSKDINLSILTSSSSSEDSVGSQDNKLSIYTKYLVEGIETGAADKDGDKLISVNELHEYASERVQEEAPAMTPKFHLSLEGEDTIYLAKSPLAATDPKFKYRKKVEDTIRKWNDEDIKDYLFEILDYSHSFAKSQGVGDYKQCNYEQALLRFKKAWQPDKREPESLIYLNNALLEAKKADYYTIAVAVSISPANQHDSIGDSRAKEMLRGVAQLQTKINLGLFDANDPLVKDFPGQGILNGKAINGKGLKVIITNDENDESKAKQRAEALSNRPEVLGVVGHYPSEMTVATVDIYDKENLVLISPGTTTQELTEYPENKLTKHPRKNFLRTVFSVEQQSPFIAKFLLEKSIKNAVSFYSSGSPFGDSFNKSFTTIFKNVLQVDEFDLGKPDFDGKKAIQELRRQEEITQTKIGLVLFPKAVSNDQGNAIELIKLNNSQNWIIGSWGLYSPNTLKQIDNLQSFQSFQKFVVAVPLDSLTSPNQDFLKDVKNLWGTTSVNAITALSYDATLALTKALELEKENNPKRINILHQLKSPNFIVVGGATGTIEFNPENGDRKNPSVKFVHIVECRRGNLDFAFVPIKYSTAKDAGLTCLNSIKKPNP